MAKISLDAPPSGMEYVLQPIRKERLEELREERDRLKAELDAMVKPTNEELIEMAKQMHPFWRISNALEAVQIEINLTR